MYALAALSTTVERMGRAVTVEEIEGLTGAWPETLRRRLQAAQHSGHTVVDSDGRWYPTAEGWDRIGGYRPPRR